MGYRCERDALGEKRIDERVYWGIHTERARENFFLSGVRMYPSLIQALAVVKKACAEANAELGYLSAENARVIRQACDEICAGGHPDQFPLDAYQGGAGTSANMNLNEVIANRALELLGSGRGAYELIHPIETVNLHQSTNDVYPTAVRIACIRKLRELSARIAAVQGALQAQERAAAGVVMIGRTELQEAVPVTMGAQFGAFAEAFGRDRWRTSKAEERLRVVNIGGTAVGTGLTAPRDYIFLVIEKLRALTGLGLSRGEQGLDATANTDVFSEVGGILSAHACTLIKLSNDLRLMGLLGEIVLPALQAGSSVMPGKVNPVIQEAVAQAGMRVLANEQLLARLVSSGTFQINEFMPLIAHTMLESLELLINADGALAGHLPLIRVDETGCAARLHASKGVVTAFVPVIGYERASALLKEFDAAGATDMRAFLTRHLGRELVDRTLSAENIMSLGTREHGTNA